MKYLCLYVVVISVLIFQGCALTSEQYRKAVEDSQNPWGFCSGSNDFGPIKDIRLFKLFSADKNVEIFGFFGTHKIDKKRYWLEGHSEFVDDDERDWRISIYTEREISNSEPSRFCVTKNEITSLPFRQRTDAVALCENELTVASPIRASLQTLKGKWFLLDISCRKAPDL